MSAVIDSVIAKRYWRDSHAVIRSRGMGMGNVNQLLGKMMTIGG